MSATRLPDPNDIFFAPCSREAKEGTYRNFQATVLTEISPAEYLQIPDFEYETVAAWGVVGGNQSHWEEMQPGDRVLFYTKKKAYTHAATVVEKQHDESLADEIWTTYDEGRSVEDLTEPWPYLFYLTDVEQVDIYSPDIHSAIGWDTYYPQSFTRVIDHRRERLIGRYGSLLEALRQLSGSEYATAPNEAEDTEQELLSNPPADPDLTDDDTNYVETTRKARSAAFRRAVRTAYDDTCAMCGSQRYTPAGTPEVEAAHIYPKSQDGRSIIRNGLALCKLHHWGFDSGWLSVTDECEILVRDASDLEEQEPFTELAGRSLYLPDDESHSPHPTFLRAHRELHGFD